ncbi:MAG: acyl carrier protein [Caldilineaceae bacterium]|jgi:acyl carrier protein|uniref:Acyl carrier protein n=1 Tax=Caldilineaceae bacterium SB0662_bin_9 TaxID=2605258 RepID=A0A6B1DNF8_9CHLR|nr:acyl carrier protein [Caldilineaceae bacterium]MCY3657815.1 acyl carrier protein [Caldilineaceae bacterium]MDE0672682.1 acyl carrier protein [Caldilineaceae bacterium]MYD88958.1 acyl carrier protein [Caldilineaceae bacterium SB0662_bin_9]
MSSTLDRVKEIIVDHLDVDSDEIQMDSNFRDDLNADSLDLVELIMAFEEEFESEISDEEAQALQSVGDVVNYLDNQS